jgi:D-alanyl-D-alanine carboxypeptidase (penicillin-binding protein 5/6)
VSGGRPAKRLAVAGAVALSTAFLVLVPAAAGHVNSPTVTALHAFVGDPLFGLDTAEGKLFGISEDEQTAMASTTKLMTLDVTLHAVDDGVVSLDDQVTVDPFAASLEPPNSVMADINGVTLEPGEVVSLRTLIRGMMYPSGNDAAWAIAFHVAQAYGVDENGDTVIDGLDFVELMNQHALAIGLTDTHFTSPNGWDDAAHYTTARELARIIDHGLDAHPYFGQVIGFSGTYTDTSQGPNGTKTYSWGWGFNYPGWEGMKGGGTTNCNGPNQGCQAISAKRIGRRVVATFMQGTFGDEPGMFDYGFGQIFHPDPRGSSASVGVAGRFDLDCISSSRCVSAAVPSSGGPVELVSWGPDVDSSSIAVLDQEPVPGSGSPPPGGNGQGPERDTALTHLPSGPIVVASRKGSSVDLSRWSLDGGGALSLVANKIKAGPATTMDLQAVYGDMFLTAVTDPVGDLVVKSWQLDGSDLVNLDTYRDESRVYNEVAMAGPLTTDVFTGHRAVTAAIAPGVLVHDVWGVDSATGAITRLGELVQAGTRDKVEISPFYVNTTFDGELFPPAYYATAFRANGNLSIRFYRIDSSGDPVDEGAKSTTFPIDEAGVAPLGTAGVMSALHAADGTVRLIAWDARRNANDSISPDQISQHTALDAGSLDFARVPSTHAEGDYVTTVTDVLTGELRLRAYRSGDRPY